LTPAASGPEPLAQPELPLSYAGVTATCGLCDRSISTSHGRKWCSGCRQKAYRRRKQQAVSQGAPPAGLPVKPFSVYECPSCQVRLLGQQRCPDCNLWMGRIGLGGLCPHCEEPVTLADLGLSLIPGGAMP